MNDQLRFAVVGPGRAGESFRRALLSVGAECVDVIGRGDDPGRIDLSVDLILLTVPDRAIAEVAAQVPVGPLVAHVSGAATLDALLVHHQRCGSLHPLLSLPNGEAGASALLAGANVAVAGSNDDARDELIAVAHELGASPFVVQEADRAIYHASAAIAANHLVALAAQVERLTNGAGLPMAPFIDMMRAVLDNVERSGAAPSLTGPVSRADWTTVEKHLDALPEPERPLYLAMASACADLAGVDFPFSPSTDAPEEQP